MKNQRYKTSRDLPFQQLYPLRSDKKCRLCEKPLMGKQTSWCSDDCQNIAYRDVMIRRGHPAFIRDAVFARDGGICAACGLDCEAIQKISDNAFHSLYEICWNYISPEDRYPQEDENGRLFVPAEKIRKEFFKFARNLWKNSPLNFGSACWHADHIVEVVNGGSNDLSNIQTLCVSCHKLKTRNLVKKREKL